MNDYEKYIKFKYYISECPGSQKFSHIYPSVRFDSEHDLEKYVWYMNVFLLFRCEIVVRLERIYALNSSWYTEHVICILCMNSI